MSGLTDDWDSIPVSDKKSSSNGLTDDWDSVPITQKSTQSSSISAGKAQGQRIAQAGSNWWDDVKSGNWKALPIVGAGEAAANTVTGLGSSIVGGLSGLAKTGYGLVTGQGLDKSIDAGSQAIQSVQEAGTYQPRTSGGKLLTEVTSVPMNAVSEMTRSTGGDVGQVLGNRNAGESIGQVLPSVVGTVMAGKSALQAVRQPTAAPPQEIPQQTQTPSIAVSDVPAYLRKGQEGFGTLQYERPPQAETLSSQLGGQSVGVAQSTYAQQAAASGASPEVQMAIAKAEKDGSLNTTAAQRHIESSSLPMRVDLTAGQATGDVNLLSHEQNVRGKYPQLAERLNSQNGQLIGNINAIRDNAAPDIFAANHVENGQALIDSYNAKDAALTTDISAKYQALKDANGGQFPVSGQDFVSAADAALKKDNVTRFLPSEVSGILGDLRDGGPMNFNDFENYRTILAQQARKADRAGDGTASHAISLVRESLENIPMSNETASIKPLADAARSAAKARFDMLRNDPAYNAAVNGTVAPDDFIQKYVVNGKVDNLKTMRQNLAEDPTAAQTISAGAINYLKNRANVTGDTGNFSQSGYNKALQSIGPKLDQLVAPEHAEQLKTLGNVARYTQEQPRGSYVNNSNTLTGALAGGAKDLANGVLDVKTFGISKFIRNQLQKNAETKAVNQSLSPAAGTTKLKDFP